MTKIELEHVFDFNLEQVVAGREARYTNKEWWPEILEAEIEKEETIDGVLHRRRRLLLENKMAQNQIIKDGQYVIIEDCWSNLNENLYRLTAVLETHARLVDFKEESRYLQFEEGGRIKAKREIVLSVNIKVPLLGKVVETFVAREFEKLSNKDKELISEYLKTGSH